MTTAADPGVSFKVDTGAGYAINGSPPHGPREGAGILSVVRSGDWLDAQVFPPLRWAVDGLIPQGFGLLTGAPKAGKSWLALGLGLAVASGTPALGAIEMGQPRPVLYLALEDGDARLQGRARQLLDLGVPIPSGLYTVTRCVPGEVLDIIGAWLDVHGDDGPLVLLDTLGKVMPPTLPGEGVYQRDYRIGGRIKAHADEHPGSTLLVVHHTRKAGVEADWMDSTSGTNGLNGAADFTLNLSRTRSSDSGLLRVTGRDVSEGDYAVSCRAGTWTLDGQSLPEAARAAATARAVDDLGDLSADVVTFVNGQKDGVRAADVAEAVGMDAATARTYLGRLADSGRIERRSRGLYAPVASVASVASSSENATRATHATPPLEREVS